MGKTKGEGDSDAVVTSGHHWHAHTRMQIYVYMCAHTETHTYTQRYETMVRKSTTDFRASDSIWANSPANPYPIAFPVTKHLRNPEFKSKRQT